MPRQYVQDTDIQNFRQRLQAFSRRQSGDIPSMASNTRKRRPSQSWQDIQRQEMQFTEDWRDSLCFNEISSPTKKRRSIIPQQDEYNTTLNQLSPFTLPSPSSSGQSQYFSSMDAEMMSPPSPMTYGPSFTEYREPQLHALRIPASADEVLPSIETDDLDMPSATYSRSCSSAWDSEPMTPEGPYVDESEKNTGNPSDAVFVDISSLAEHERNLVTAFVPQETRGLELQGMPYRKGQGKPANMDKTQTAGADFEAAFEEFLNVS